MAIVSALLSTGKAGGGFCFGFHGEIIALFFCVSQKIHNFFGLESIELLESPPRVLGWESEIYNTGDENE